MAATDTDPDAPDPKGLPPVSWHATTRHPQTEIGDPPRRTMAVGHVYAVMVITLIVGALLNAPGIHKTALGQDVGLKRDIATFFAEPLADVSHALFLDRPRAGLQAITGRSGDDDIDLTLPSPTTGKPGSTTPTTLPRRAFSPQHQLSVYVAGDSLAETPGESVINQGLATGVMGILGPVDSQVSTGLARPEVFNWPAHLAEVLSPQPPAGAVVLTIGSNDDQTLTGDGGVGPVGSDAWITEYRRRVGGLMDQVTGNGTTTLFWVGIPLMRNTERFDTRYKIIDDIIHQEADKRPGKVVYVDTVPVLAGPDGGYADFLQNVDGSVVQVRAGDGIHFTRAGGDRIAGAVITAMRKTFDLDSWQTQPPTTAPTTTTTKAKASK